MLGWILIEVHVMPEVQYQKSKAFYSLQVLFGWVTFSFTKVIFLHNIFSFTQVWLLGDVYNSYIYFADGCHKMQCKVTDSNLEVIKEKTKKKKKVSYILFVSNVRWENKPACRLLMRGQKQNCSYFMTFTQVLHNLELFTRYCRFYLTCQFIYSTAAGTFQNMWHDIKQLANSVRSLKAFEFHFNQLQD